MVTNEAISFGKVIQSYLCKAYQVQSVNTNRVIIGGYQYSIELEFLGNMGEVEFESQMTGGLIQNDHSITSSIQVSLMSKHMIDSYFTMMQPLLKGFGTKVGEDGNTSLLPHCINCLSKDH